MALTKVTILLSLFVISNAFLFDTFFPKDQCKTDADCTSGCCHRYMTSTGTGHNKCSSYILPAGACQVGSTFGCGCMKGYACFAPGTDGLALEPNTHIKGYCNPMSTTNSTGPQIAVEGGR